MIKFKELTEKYIGNATEKNKKDLEVPLHPVNHLDISEYEKKALRGYVDCCNINFHHRGTLPQGTEKQSEHMIADYKKRAKEHSDFATPHLDNLLRKHKIEHDVHLWRGISFEPQYKKGDIFHDKGYTSTSTHPGKADSFGLGDHLFHIKVPKGSNAIDVNSILGKHPRDYEKEVLLPRNSKFRYNGLKTNNIGQKIHHLTYIGIHEDT
jgi:hypothetical protein